MKSIHGAVIYTGTEVLEDAYINFDENVIVSTAPSAVGEIVGDFPVVTPALIDPHCHIGLVRHGEPAAEAEANEHMDSILAHADVLDSIQMDDRGLIDSIESGVLYSCVLPGSGNIIGGNTAIIRNYGRNTNAAFIQRSGIKGAFGYNPMSTREWKGTRPFTRMGALALLRAKLHDVRGKMEKKSDDVDFTAEEEVIRAILNGEEVLRIHVHKEDDIAALLRFVDEFNLKVTVEHTCDIHDAGIYRELAKRGISVVFGPMDSLAYKVELKHENWRNLKHLIDSGVNYGLMTDHPVIMQKNLLLEARWFLRSGLSKQAVIELLTRKNAEIIGIGSILGVLEKDKWASFIGWTGDPFALENYPQTAYGEGTKLF